MSWSLDNVLYSLSMLLFTLVWLLQCIYFATCWLLADLHGSYVRVRMLRSSHPWVDLHFPCRVMWITPFFLPKCVRNGWNKSQNVHIWLWKIWPFFIGQISCCCFTCILMVPSFPPARTTLLTCSSFLAQLHACTYIVVGKFASQLALVLSNFSRCSACAMLRSALCSLHASVSLHAQRFPAGHRRSLVDSPS